MEAGPEVQPGAPGGGLFHFGRHPETLLMSFERGEGKRRGAVAAAAAANEGANVAGGDGYVSGSCSYVSADARVTARVRAAT